MKIDCLPGNIPSTTDKSSTKAAGGGECADAFSTVMDQVVTADQAAPAADSSSSSQGGTGAASPDEGASNPSKASTSGDAKACACTGAPVTDMAHGKADPQVDDAPRGRRHVHHGSRPTTIESCVDASMPKTRADLRMSLEDVGQNGAQAVLGEHFPKQQPDTSSRPSQEATDAQTPVQPAAFDSAVLLKEALANQSSSSDAPTGTTSANAVATAQETDSITKDLLPKTIPAPANRPTLDLNPLPVVSAGAQVEVQTPPAAARESVGFKSAGFLKVALADQPNSSSAPTGTASANGVATAQEADDKTENLIPKTTTAPAIKLAPDLDPLSGVSAEVQAGVQNPHAVMREPVGFDSTAFLKAAYADQPTTSSVPTVTGSANGATPAHEADDITENLLPKTIPAPGNNLTLDLNPLPAVRARTQIGVPDLHAAVRESAESAHAPLQDIPASVDPHTGNSKDSLRGVLPEGASQVQADVVVQPKPPVKPAVEFPDMSLKSGPQVEPQDDATPVSPASTEESIPVSKGVQSDAADSGSTGAVIPLEAALAGIGASFVFTAAYSASRSNTKETQPMHRSTVTSEHRVTGPEEAQNLADVRWMRDPIPRVAVPIRPLADVQARADDSAHASGETPDQADAAPRMKAESQPAGSQTDGESIWEGEASTQHLPVQNPFVRVSTSDTPILQAPQSTLMKSFADSTLWAGGSEAPSQTGVSDLKALAALLTPKQSAPTEPSDFLTQLAERIQSQVRDGEDVIRVQLKPSSLGRMEIKAENSSTGVIATIVTESTGVKSYLEHNLHLLQQNFQDQGLKVDRINVAVQEGDWSQHSSSGQPDSRPGTGNRGESKSTGWHAGATDSSAEEMALDPVTQAALRPYSTFHTVA